MALYLHVKFQDGTEDEIPLLNREVAEIDDHVAEASIERRYILGRDTIGERVYKGADLTRVIKALQEGDVVEVKTYPDSYGDQRLTITKAGADEYVGENDRGDEFYLLPTFWGERNQGDGQPWLRTKGGWDSRGEIETLEILTLSDE